MVLKNLFTGRYSNGDTDIENRLMDTVRGEEERVGCIERVTWKLALPFVK